MAPKGNGERERHAGRFRRARVAAGGAEIGLASLQTGLAGRPGPDQDFNQSVWDRWNAMSPQEKAKGSLRAGEQLVTGYENLDAAARRELHLKMAFLPFPADIALMSGIRLHEANPAWLGCPSRPRPARHP